MSSDDRLPDLLSRRAEQGSGVHPTMDGVQTAIARRAERRKRQRAIGSGLAGLCLVAGIAGGIALAGGGDDTTDGVAAPLPPVPLVGIDLPGLTLTDTTQQPLVEDGDGSLGYVVFTQGDDVNRPVMTAYVGEPGNEVVDDPDLKPVDLDGDGDPNGPDDGLLSEPMRDDVDGGGVSFELDNGAWAGIGGLGVDQQFIVDYVSSLDRHQLDVDELPAPPGFDDGRVIGQAGSGAMQTVADYDYEGGSVQVITTNEPAWFDLMRVTLVAETPLREVPLGDTFLGPGRAAVADDGDSSPGIGLVHTESGLTVMLNPVEVDGAFVEDVLTEGRLIELDPLPTVPASTTTAVTATTVPVGNDSTGAGGSGTADGSVTLTDLRVERVDGSRARVVMEFDAGIPTWEVTVGSSQQPGGEGSCALAQPAADTWLNVVLGVPGGGQVVGSRLVAGAFDDLDEEDPTFFGITATVTCEPFEGAARVDVSLPDPIPRPTAVQAVEDPDRSQLVLLVDL